MGRNTITKSFLATMSLMTAMVLTVGVSNGFYGEHYNEAAPELAMKEIEISATEDILDKVVIGFKGSDYISFDVNNPLLDTAECANVAEEALEKFSEFLNGFEHVTIHDDLSLRRGLSSGAQIYMLCLEDSEEFLNVLIHELGHTVDLMHMEGTSSQGKSSLTDFGEPIMYNDPSTKFYRMSWVDETALKSEAARANFVSGYAMSDPFEDFAETFVMYVQFGEVFRYMISEEENDVLKNKYFFMKYVVFDGQEFGLEKEISFDAARLFKGGSSNLFDVTKLHNLV